MLSLFQVPVFAKLAPSQLSVQFSGEPSQFDPLMMEDGLALKLAANVIGTVMEYDSSGKLQRALLESEQMNANGTQFKLKFKSGLKWSDGVAFHADQFLLALKRMKESKVKVALSLLFPEIDLSKTKVINDREIQIQFLSPAPLFLQWCTLPPFAPIRSDLIEFYEKKRSPVLPTLAAYQVTDYKRDDHITLTKNPMFYDQANVSVDQVQLYLLKDEQNFLPLLKAGRLDILNKVPVLQLDLIKKLSTVIEVPAAATTYLGLNTKTEPFKEIENRRLFRDLVLASNAELSALLKTGEIPAQTFLPEVVAKIPLKRRGSALKNTAQVSMLLQSDSGSRNQTILEFLQHKAKEKLGWKMKIELLDWKEHLTQLKSRTPQSYRMGWQNPVESPFVFYQVLDSQSSNQFTGWKSAEYDQLVQKLKITTDPKVMMKLEEILWTEAPVIPLLHQVLRFSYSKRVSGFRANPFGVILFREIRFTQ